MKMLQAIITALSVVGIACCYGITLLHGFIVTTLGLKGRYFWSMNFNVFGEAPYEIAMFVFAAIFGLVFIVDYLLTKFSTMKRVSKIIYVYKTDDATYYKSSDSNEWKKLE